MRYIKFPKGLRDKRFSNFFFLIATLSLAACVASPPTFGLKPIYPEIACRTTHGSIFISEVDSISPVLRWETFPSESIRFGAKQTDVITDIKYDLRVWSSENYYPSSLIYARSRLPEPWHEIEEPFLPCVKYFWTVRARFLVNGKERVSEWGISAWPWVWQDPSKAYGPVRDAVGNELVRRLPVVPHPNLYRFETPCPGKPKEQKLPGIL